MPPFELNSLGGGRKTLASHRGHITLVHFFATWCEAQDLRVLAIDVGEVGPAVQRFLATWPVSIPVLLDTDRAVTKAWEISTLPTTFMLDEALTPGRVAIGEVNWGAPMVAPLLDKISLTRPTTHSGSEP